MYLAVLSVIDVDNNYECGFKAIYIYNVKLYPRIPKPNQKPNPQFAKKPHLYTY